jgi:hypothetical protein
VIVEALPQPPIRKIANAIPATPMAMTSLIGTGLFTRDTTHDSVDSKGTR